MRLMLSRSHGRRTDHPLHLVRVFFLVLFLSGLSDLVWQLSAGMPAPGYISAPLAIVGAVVIELNYEALKARREDN